MKKRRHLPSFSVRREWTTQQQIEAVEATIESIKDSRHSEDMIKKEQLQRRRLELYELLKVERKREQIKRIAQQFDYQTQQIINERINATRSIAGSSYARIVHAPFGHIPV
ncbi:MAG TPA: hypothetical protein PLS56_01365 [Candidatus Dojkabacteria bacterium]|nr:hypothetical protein [Candidatus Dojkabacteria bacterium]